MMIPNLGVSVLVVAICAALWTAEHFYWVARDVWSRMADWTNAESSTLPQPIKGRRKRKASP